MISFKQTEANRSNRASTGPFTKSAKGDPVATLSDMGSPPNGIGARSGASNYTLFEAAIIADMKSIR